MTPTLAPDDDYPHSIGLSFEYDDERVARVVGDAVAVEVGEIDDDRSTARVARDGDRLAVDVFARDLVALRAGVNTWIRLVETAEDVCSLAA
ncbi:KEOPS complex Pcc1-like subunit [Salinigranum rubrum]|uniref:KEOPS complex Pcc1-like subunit n=1 Tax=Salinigranum rubrum TaxID=755307 RepID=A0A2I8VG55_9EURY|nr:KEOPS complex subunit Pcc1 [Salinigranum rubrum]AUV80917.1 KEOPS complex Pcc1-like subunit [Salinigranum rubrum]